MENQSYDITAELRESATAFIAEHYGSRHPRFDIEEPLDVNRDLWKEMAALGWLGLTLPEAIGGLNMQMREATILAEIMGRKAVPEPFIAAAIMPSLLLSCCDESSSLVQKVAASICNGESLITLAWQEAAGEFKPQAPTVKLSSGCLTGSKCFVPAVEENSQLLVTALDGSDLVVVAIDTQSQGVKYERQSGGAMTMATVTFDNAPTLESEILLQGPAAEKALETAIEGSRLVAAAQLAGIAAGVLEKTVSYVNERIQFARPIGSFQTVQHRCVDYHMENMLAGSAWRNAQQLFDESPSSTEAKAAISAAKARSSDAAINACTGGVQMHGGMGFTEEGGVGLYLRAAMQLSNWLGSANDHRRRFLTLTT